VFLRQQQTTISHRTHKGPSLPQLTSSLQAQPHNLRFRISWQPTTPSTPSLHSGLWPSTPTATQYTLPTQILPRNAHPSQASLIKKNNNNNWDNCNPRSTTTTASYQKSVPAECYAKFERAEAAHKNSMENAPFFVGAVLAGNMVGLSACTSLVTHFRCEHVTNEGVSDDECSLGGVCRAASDIRGIVYQDDGA
jgi:hypothetical protein